MRLNKSIISNYKLLFKYILGIIFLLNFVFAQRSDIEKSGDILQVALPIAAFSSTLIWNDGQGETLQFLKSMSTTTIITYAVKRIINKPRPNGGNYGFPSGHTSAAFTGAAVLQKRFGWDVGLPAYILAGYVGWTRVNALKHDYWDVLAGATLGIGSAYLFAKPYKYDVSFGKLGNGFKLDISYRF